MSSRAPGRPRSAVADNAILDAALDLLIERGVEATSIEQVAKRAGVTRATVYRRFPDKIALLMAAIELANAESAELSPEILTPEQMLSYWAIALAGPRQRKLARRLMTGLRDYPELHEAYWKASIQHREKAIETVLRQAREQGHFPPGTDLRIVRRILTGAVADHLTNESDDCSVTEITEFLLAVLHHTNYTR